MQMQHRESDMIKYSWKKKSNCQFQLSNALRGNINNLKHFFFHVNSYIYAIPIIFSPLVCNVCLFVSLFVWGFSSHSRIFHSYGDANMTGEGLQILTNVYARDSRPLSSDGSLACHTYCDTGHSTIAESLAVELSFVLSRLGFEYPTFRLCGERSNPLCHRCGWFVMKP